MNLDRRHFLSVLGGATLAWPRTVEALGSQLASGGISGRSTPPRSPAFAMNSMSLTASSRSFGRITPMPARRTGSSSQNSFSQRLCARIPARQCSYSSGFGGPLVTMPFL